MPIYDYECRYCGNSAAVECRMSEREEKWPECDVCLKHMDSLITNNTKHIDHTESRKGFHNSKEGRHR